MNTTLRYSPRAAGAVAYFKRRNNDIDIFVEDKAAPNLWVKMLNNFLPEGTKLESVTPLGGRKEVIEACKLDQDVSERRALYLIDADFDLLHGKPKKKLKKLYRLRSYCVENYLLNEDSILSAATTFDDAATVQEAKQRLGFSEWVRENNNPLRMLFVCYAVANKLDESIATIKLSVHPLFRDCRVSLCPQKTFVRVLSIYRTLRAQFDRSVIETIKAEVEERFDRLGLLAVVSGKDYLFPAFRNQFKSQFGLTVKDDVFKVMLADKSGCQIDPYLKRRLTQIL
ncbi:hypothetical protein GCM10007094_28520 [Pseudovibrio japonicus]|uniref:DUF4435 domain-containing protein n=1 Tax=Pseudovibrio japonicus TaxID=366534 RepID=A0ABQ3EFZ9_9HYPH|nr:DUF4435 domain-containing protein [Pseudovibrio japonicus]GHB37492.1 hypothetical protein GCM10007094_28520 [Pseudovibrio japonicus]